MSEAELMAAPGRPGGSAPKAASSRHLPLQPRRQRPDRAGSRALPGHAAPAGRGRGPNAPRHPLIGRTKLRAGLIVEKETGGSADRGLVAGVFVNRLRIGMPLQTDPR